MGIVLLVYRVTDYEKNNDFKIQRGGRDIPSSPLGCDGVEMPKYQYGCHFYGFFGR